MAKRTRKLVPAETPANGEGEGTENSDRPVKDDSEGQFYIALSHEIRREIIKMVGQNQKSSFTEFKRTLNCSTGTLYHHLEVLGDLIYQKPDKKYYLTVLGEHAYNILAHNLESIETSKESEAKPVENQPSFFKNLVKIWPRIYFSITQKDPRIPLVLLIALLGIGGLLCSIFDVSTILIFFTWEKSTEPIALEIKVWYFFQFVLSMLAFYVIAEVLCRIILRRKDNPVPFLLSFFIILIPMIFYLVVHSFFYVLAYDVIAVNFDRVVMVFFQIWSIWYLTYAISVLKFVPIERGFIVSFISYYAGFVILLATII